MSGGKPAVGRARKSRRFASCRSRGDQLPAETAFALSGAAIVSAAFRQWRLSEVPLSPSCVRLFDEFDFLCLESVLLPLTRSICKPTVNENRLSLGERGEIQSSASSPSSSSSSSSLAPAPPEFPRLELRPWEACLRRCLLSSSTRAVCSPCRGRVCACVRERRCGGQRCDRGPRRKSGGVRGDDSHGGTAEG